MNSVSVFCVAIAVFLCHVEKVESKHDRDSEIKKSPQVLGGVQQRIAANGEDLRVSILDMEVGQVENLNPRSEEWPQEDEWVNKNPPRYLTSHQNSKHRESSDSQFSNIFDSSNRKCKPTKPKPATRKPEKPSSSLLSPTQSPARMNTPARTASPQALAKFIMDRDSDLENRHYEDARIRFGNRSGRNVFVPLVGTPAPSVSYSPSSSPSMSPTTTEVPFSGPSGSSSSTSSLSPSSNPSFVPTASPSNFPSISPSLSPSNDDCNVNQEGIDCCEHSDCLDGDSCTLGQCVPVSSITLFPSRGTVSGSRIVALVTPDGDLAGAYYVDFDMEVNDFGLVTLDAIADTVGSVVCSGKGTVHISLWDGFGLTEPEKMFPDDTVLVINHELFGACTLQEEEIELLESCQTADAEDEEEVSVESKMMQENSLQNGNTYLRIESVSGTMTNVTLHGTPVSYVALFRRATIDIREIPEHEARRLAIITLKPRQFSISATAFTIGPLNLTVTGSVTDRGKFVGFHADWNESGITLEYITEEEKVLDLRMDSVISASASKTTNSTRKKLFSKQIYGIDTGDFFKSTDDATPGFKFPSFKIGFFFEIPLAFSINVLAKQKLGTNAFFNYTTGRDNVTLSLKGSFNGLQLDKQVTAISESTTDYDFEFEETRESAEILVAFFAGVRLQLAAYVDKFFDANIGANPGIETRIQYAPGEGSFPPEADTGGVMTFGNCQDCHDLKLRAAWSLQDIGASARLDLRPWLKKKQQWSVPFSGTNVDIPFAAACAWPRDVPTNQCNEQLIDLELDDAFGGEEETIEECYGRCYTKWIVQCEADCGGNPIFVTICKENCQYQNGYILCQNDCREALLAPLEIPTFPRSPTTAFRTNTLHNHVLTGPTPQATPVSSPTTTYGTFPTTLSSGSQRDQSTSIVPSVTTIIFIILQPLLVLLDLL